MGEDDKKGMLQGLKNMHVLWLPGESLWLLGFQSLVGHDVSVAAHL